MNLQKRKKLEGVVYTPEWIAAYMAREIFAGKKLRGNEKILDAGCGAGVFSVAVAREFSRLTKKSIESVIAENIFFTDINAEAVSETKENLEMLANKKSVQTNGTMGDFCFSLEGERFDYIIGNPPYVRIQNLNERRAEIQKSFSTAASGSIDLYFCFFERALALLAFGGRIAFITPNSHFYSHAGKNLRSMLLPHLSKIVNFDHFQVFPDATAYTAITFLESKHTPTFLYAENFKNDVKDIAFRTIDKKNLHSDRWQFFDREHSRKLAALRKEFSSLEEIADIHYGIATLKDDVYIFSPEEENEKYFMKDGFKIERSVCVPIIKASTYKGKDQYLFLLFPYKNERVIAEDIFKKEFPEAFRYLLSKRSLLEERDKGGGREYEEFYAFGRSQGLKTSFGKKILTSTMNLFPRFFVVEDERSSFFAGYCIKPKNGMDIYALCDTLNSDSMKEYIDSVSKSYRGGYKSYAKSFLKGFVHPTFRRTQQVLF